MYRPTNERKEKISSGRQAHLPSQMLHKTQSVESCSMSNQTFGFESKFRHIHSSCRTNVQKPEAPMN
ncbi:hypothetical protein BLOT_012509 [Blomia tropicalis]|nr:hypothetical protein BLOT_012509 [Blomia tropicalis]